MKRIVMLALLAGTITSFGTPIAHAQPAMALGKPLPDAQLPAGTVAVKVVAGGGANVVVGADVTLLVNGEARVARTNSDGRAMFPACPRAPRCRRRSSTRRARTSRPRHSPYRQVAAFASC